MVIIDSLKHNRFKKVTIPRPSELVRQFGLTHIGEKYSGEEFLSPNESKVDIVKNVANEVFDTDTDKS